MFGYRNWLKRKGHTQHSGINNALITMQKRLMTDYEKITISLQLRPCTRNRPYVFDISYFDLEMLPQIQFALDCDFCVTDDADEETTILLECQSVSDFVVGTIFVFDRPHGLQLAEAWEIQFWDSSFSEQLEWFIPFAIQEVRLKSKETNWLIRKNFLITFHHPIEKEQIHSTAMSKVFNNKDLIRCIGGFI